MPALKIMVVDDAPFIREIVKQILSDQEKYELVGEAENGYVAIEQTAKLSPDVIFMDIVMPELSGIKATEEILKIKPRTKIIAFTTMDNSAIKKQAMEAGCRGFLKKPFSKKEFLMYLKKVEVL